MGDTPFLGESQSQTCQGMWYFVVRQRYRCHILATIMLKKITPKITRKNLPVGGGMFFCWRGVWKKVWWKVCFFGFQDPDAKTKKHSPHNQFFWAHDYFFWVGYEKKLCLRTGPKYIINDGGPIFTGR